jgi:hypothetical protein
MGNCFCDKGVPHAWVQRERSAEPTLAGNRMAAVSHDGAILVETRLRRTGLPPGDWKRLAGYLGDSGSLGGS